MQKVYALFGDDAAGSPFRLDSAQALEVLRERFPDVRHYRQFLKTGEQLDHLVLAPFCASAELWLEEQDESFTTSEAIALGLGIVPERIDRSLQTRIGPLLHELGCTKHRARKGQRRGWVWKPPVIST